MRILRRGTAPAERKYIATCRHCQTQVEFEEREARRGEDQREGIHFAVDCPVCKQPIYAYPGAITPQP